MDCKKTHSKCSVNGSDHQLFPDTGRLANGQRNVSLDKLKEIGHQGYPSVYLYIVATIKYKDQEFLQDGTGPNFQGDRITLCTCKHYMRSSMSVDNWKGIWVAGFTGGTCVEESQGRNYLVYLMKVSEAFKSFHDFWENISDNKTKSAKAAHKHRFGDIYEPKDSDDSKCYQAEHYVSPCENGNYDRDSCWRKDIKYYSKRFERRAALLAGDKRKSFLWDHPKIYYRGRLYRGYQKRAFSDFIDGITE